MWLAVSLVVAVGLQQVLERVEREKREGEGERSSVVLQCVSMSESVAQVYNYRSGIVTR